MIAMDADASHGVDPGTEELCALCIAAARPSPSFPAIPSFLLYTGHMRPEFVCNRSITLN